MRDKQEKNNQIADPPLLNAIKKGKTVKTDTLTLAGSTEKTQKQKGNTIEHQTSNTSSRKTSKREGRKLLFLSDKMRNAEGN